MDCQREADYDDQEQELWYRDAKYNRYWRHYQSVWNWFRHHQRVSSELKHKSYLSRMQQWYQHQMSDMYGHMWNPNFYLQHVNWAYYMHLSQQQYMHPMNSVLKSQYEMGSPSAIFKTPTAPAPRARSKSQSSTKHVVRDKRNASPNSSSSSGSGRSRRRHRHRKKMRKNQHHRRLSIRLSEGSVTVEESDSDGESSEQFEMEITDDMLQFFALSAKHRHLRDTEKMVNETNGKKKGKKEDTYVELAEVTEGKNKATVRAPTERPGVKRTAEMKMLFGKGAAMIHGMETAMQLNFDRNCDLKQPKLWPHLPLKIKFD